MVDVDSCFRITSQQVFVSVQNELLFSSRYEVVRQVTVQTVRRDSAPVNTAAFQTRVRIVSFERRNESVALTNDRLDESRMFCIVAKRPPDFAYGGVDRGVLVDEHIGTPQCCVNLRAIDKETGFLDESDEYLHRNLFELDPLTRPAQHVRRNVEFELAKTEAARHG